MSPAQQFWSRRAALRLLAAGMTSVAVPRVASSAFAAEGADALVLVLSDLHSAYARYPATIAAIDALSERHAGVPMLIVVNGDLFERANAVALRTAGEADLAFLRTVSRRAPTVFNLGNHETALFDDMADAVQLIRSAGGIAVSSMRDRRGGAYLAAPRAEITASSRRFTVAGLATDDLTTYRAAPRALLDIPEPGRALAPHRDLLAKADIPVVASHAGLVADRSFLEGLPDGTLVIGGHDHLNLVHEAGNCSYVHAGSYLGGFTTVAIQSRGGRKSHAFTRIEVEPGVGDPNLTYLIRQLNDRHLTEAEKTVVAAVLRTAPLGEAARFLVQAMARAAEADVGLVNHTTLGGAIEQGTFTAHDLANFIRFDGALFVTEIEGGDLMGILERANQDRDMPFQDRSGDFLYATSLLPVAGRRYRIATNGWVRQNATRYLGRDDLTFREVPDRMIRAAFEKALLG